MKSNRFAYVEQKLDYIQNMRISNWYIPKTKQWESGFLDSPRLSLWKVKVNNRKKRRKKTLKLTWYRYIIYIYWNHFIHRNLVIFQNCYIFYDFLFFFSRFILSLIISPIELVVQWSVHFSRITNRRATRITFIRNLSFNVFISSFISINVFLDHWHFIVDWMVMVTRNNRFMITVRCLFHSFHESKFKTFAIQMEIQQSFVEFFFLFVTVAFMYIRLIHGNI